MVDPGLIKKIKKDFKFLLEDEIILGVLLYGSYIKNMNVLKSDIDICIVCNPPDKYKQVFKQICQEIDIYGKKYDIHFFDNIPWFLKGKILDEAIVILTPNEPYLFEYLYPFRKIWNDQKDRQKISKKELIEIFQGKF